jgi:hypothetical protein
MENKIHSEPPARPDCFTRAEIEIFQSLEGQLLQGVTYYLWLHTAEGSKAQPYRFLYALELLFESGASLLVSCGEDSESIRVITAESLLETAASLQALHGQAVIQRVVRDAQGIWQGSMGQELTAIRLSKHNTGLYRNDALLLDFGKQAIVVELVREGEGLEVCMA